MDGENLSAMQMFKEVKRLLNLQDANFPAALELSTKAYDKLEQENIGEDAKLWGWALHSVALEVNEKHEECRVVKEKMLNLSIKTNGEQHEETILARGTLGSTYSDLNLHELAEKEILTVIAWRKKNLGQDHEDTLLALHNLGREQALLFKNEESLTTFKKCLHGRTSVLGEDHEDTVSTELWYAKMLYNTKDFEETMKVCQHCLKMCTKVYGPHDALTKRCEDLLEKASKRYNAQSSHRHHPSS